jgi:hypothetical protein
MPNAVPAWCGTDKKFLNAPLSPVFIPQRVTVITPFKYNTYSNYKNAIEFR